MAELGRAHAGLPDDLLNFHYDPVACAVALGWSGAVVAEMRLQPVREGEVLRFQPDEQGRSHPRGRRSGRGAFYRDLAFGGRSRPAMTGH